MDTAAECARFVPIVGCGHTGTTLLAAMLGSHSACYAIPEETELFLRSGPGSAAWRLRLLRRVARDWGARVLVEKTPRHVRYLDAIYDAAPDARAVGVVRDPRDVVASLMRRKVDFEAALARWVRDTGALAEAYRAQQAFVVRYEDLIARPEAVLAALGRDIGVAYEPAMLSFHENPQQWFASEARPHEQTHEGRRNAQIHQPLTDRRGIWRQRLSAEAERRIVAESGALMALFGYDPDRAPTGEAGSGRGEAAQQGDG